MAAAAAAAASGSWRAEKEDDEGEAWMSGGVWPKALSPRCWESSCW